MQHKSVCFIGAGNMSRSIISGLVKSGYPAKLITAANPSQPKLTALAKDFGVQTTQDNQQAVNQSDVIVLAVKPQLMADMCQQLEFDSHSKQKLFVSIAAGLTVNRLQAMLGFKANIIRTMPNTPSLLGKGMTGLYAQPNITSDEQELATYMMSQVGEIMWCNNEEDIDLVIAASGSSPAYFFLFLEAMQAKVQADGLSKQDARLLVQQAMLGAAEMVCHNPNLELSELRAQVTSKGGTTAKAIEYFQSNDISHTIGEAMQAAVDRAKQMSQEF